MRSASNTAFRKARIAATLFILQASVNVERDGLLRAGRGDRGRPAGSRSPERETIPAPRRREAATMTETRQSVTGRILAIWRYPVKSMLGEELDAAEVTGRGL